MESDVDVTSTQDTISFESFLARRVPAEFLAAARPLIEESYSEAYQVLPGDSEDLPYVRNLIPHDRNRRVFEHLHRLADELGIAAEARCLDNGYRYLEVESSGVVLHVKHFRPYQKLSEQLVDAGYRKQRTSLNLSFGQMPLFAEGSLSVEPNEAFVLMFYEDSHVRRDELGSIYFVLPSHEAGSILSVVSLETVIACTHDVNTDTGFELPADDGIELPSKSTMVAKDQVG